MKKVLLLSPHCEENILNSANADKKYSPPLGLLYLATNVKYIANIKILDAYNRNYSDEYILEEINKFRPDIVGISINFFFSMNPGIVLAKKIRERFKDIILFCGGNAATYSCDKMLREGFDYVSLHEGENTFREMMLAPTNDFRNIEGIAYLDIDGVHASKRDDIVDLDTLPIPDYSFLEGYQDYSIMISSSRGCPYNCFYCSTKQMWGIHWRKRSAQSIFNEIKTQMELFGYSNNVNVSFCDDNFLVDRERFFQLAELFEKDSLKCNIGFSARIELVNEEILTKAKEMGTKSIFFGIESGSEKMLKKLNRRYTKESVLEKITLCEKMGISVTTSFMIGIPGEQTDDVKETFSLIRSLPNKNIQIHVCTALPGTDMWIEPEKYGIISEISDEKIGNIDYGSSFDTKYFSREEIDAIYMRAYALVTSKERIK